jgi:hypothetical protein
VTHPGVLFGQRPVEILIQNPASARLILLFLLVVAGAAFLLSQGLTASTPNGAAMSLTPGVGSTTQLDSSL